MYKHWQQFFSILTIVGLLAPSLLPLRAEEPFRPEYLLSDEEMQNWWSMSVSDIQQFLNEQGGYLARYRTIDSAGIERNAADIIANAAREHRINPRYLLVKLQKEQSLVIHKDPTQRQLDWATGYGVCDSCSTNDPAIQKFRGFGIQVDKAAAIIRWYYDNVGKEPWIKQPNVTYLIDHLTVRPANLATAFLYTYTPHLHGNRNFWKIWQAWFGQVYPDGTIMKTITDPTVYVIQGSKRRPFKNLGALLTRYDPRLIISVPASEINRYEVGTEITLPNYSILSESNVYYLLDHDTLRPFENEAAFRTFGYHPDEVIAVSQIDIAGYQKGTTITAAEGKNPLGRLIQVRGGSQVYYMRDGIYHHVTDPQIVKRNFPHLQKEIISQDEFNTFQLGLPVAFKDGTLIKAKGSATTYVIENGKKRPIAEDVFLALGFRKENIIQTDEITLLHHSSGQPIFIRQPVQVAQADEPETTGESTSSSPGTQMLRTPIEKTDWSGPQFATPMNTYLIMDYDTEKILAAKNHREVRPMASFTKVITAYELVQEGINLRRHVTYDPAKHQSQYHRYRIAAGERVYNEDLLSAMLVSSLNTPARMLVSSIETNESSFVSHLNQRIKDWGLPTTRLTDPAGVNTTTVTTAQEFATIFKRTAANTVVREFLAKPGYEYNEALDVDGKPYHYDIHSNELVRKEGLPFRIVASKTAYLEEAGAGLVMLIERPTDGKKFIVVTMGNPDYANRFVEPERLARWAIATF